MITEYLFLSPSGEVMSSLHEIRQYVEEHYADHRLCPDCGCYLIPSGQTHRFLFRVYRCANSICSATQRTFKLWPFSLRRAA